MRRIRGNGSDIEVVVIDCGILTNVSRPIKSSVRPVRKRARQIDSVEAQGEEIDMPVSEMGDIPEMTDVDLRSAVPDIEAGMGADGEMPSEPFDLGPNDAEAEAAAYALADTDDDDFEDLNDLDDRRTVEADAADGSDRGDAAAQRGPGTAHLRDIRRRFPAGTHAGSGEDGRCAALADAI